MRSRWFRPSDDNAHPFDDTPVLVRALSGDHELHVFTETNAHDFVWQHFRVPSTTCACSNWTTRPLIGSSGHTCSGMAVCCSSAHGHCTTAAPALVHAGRLEHYVAEFTFDAGHPPYLAHGTDYIRSDDWPMLRAPVIASRVTVATHPGVAQALQDEYPHARVRCAPVPVQAGNPRREHRRPERSSGPEEVVFGVLTNDRVEVARRAFAHAQKEGSRQAC